MEEDLIPQARRALCRLEDIPDGAAVAFPASDGGVTGLLAVRRGAEVFVYVNACPHIGTPLDWVPGRFLAADGKHLICATHGAEFRIADGVCTRGPCRDEALEAVLTEIKDGVVLVQDYAGR
jgi:nitrite reductase/ring-hydroxylating ferredoxin subunit